MVRKMRETRSDPAMQRSESGFDGAGKEIPRGQSPVRMQVRPEDRDPMNPDSWGKVARNDACPCGSGKKYKHCHGAIG
jgi:preprotein translocase subunit SecA